MKSLSMYTVQELFRSVPASDLADFFIKNILTKEGILRSFRKKIARDEMDLSYLTGKEFEEYAYEDYKNKTLNCIKELKTLKCPNIKFKPEEVSILGIVEYCDSDYDRKSYDTFVFSEKNIDAIDATQLKDCKTVEEVKASISFANVCVNFMFDDWKNVLCYRIPGFLFKNFSKCEIAACVLFELTWNGYDYETAKKNQAAFFDGLSSIEPKKKAIVEDSNIPDTENHDSAPVNDPDEIDLKIPEAKPYEYSEGEKKEIVDNHNETIRFFRECKKYFS